MYIVEAAIRGQQAYQVDDLAHVYRHEFESHIGDVSMIKFLQSFDKYYIGIETADGRKHCIRGWYLDQRFDHKECPKGFHMYEFREDDEDEWGYIAFIEPHEYSRDRLVSRRKK